MKLKPGRQISHYQILESLGIGGMATVFKAQDLKLDRFVALKFLPIQVGVNSEEKTRFIQEAKTASALDHPNICTVYEIDEAPDGQMFISMAYCEGETLKTKIERGPLSVKEAISIVRQVADGLSRAHEKGIIHRDIKPANLIVTPDNLVKILDFGVAKLQHKEIFTSTGSLIGTPGYMSPEQASGKSVDQRTDVWAVGTILFEALTAHLPFSGDSDLSLMYAIVNEPPLPLNKFRGNISPDLQRIVDRALSKLPELRYQDMKELFTDLAQLDKENSISQETRVMTPVASPRGPSIAVLPFIDISPDKDQEYFCDGLTEEIINALSRIQGLQVVSRNSAFQFKGQTLDIQHIGQRLGVHKILEGSIRKGGNRIRIAVRLINVADGFLVWADDYQRELEDIFAIQDDIARSIVRKLEIDLAGLSETQVLKRYTSNLDAFNYYLRGRFQWNKRTAESLENSIEQFKNAIAIDPSYTLAYAGLADAYIVLGLYGRFSASEMMPQAIEAAHQALRQDEMLAEAHISLGCAQAVYQWNWEEAQKAFKRGIELKSEYATAHHWYAINYLAPLNRGAEALAAVNRAREIEPASLVINATVGLIHYFSRDYDAAVKSLQKTLELDPEFPVSNFFLGRAYVQQGRFKEAIDHFQKALKYYGDSTNMLATFGHAAALADKKEIAHKVLSQLQELSTRMYVSAYDIASIYCGLDDRDKALNWLEKAFQEHAYLLIYLNTDPIMDSLREEKRFQQIVQKIFSNK